MRWIFILLLVMNTIYFGWEMDHQFKMDRNKNSSVHMLMGAEKLELISESKEIPGLYERQDLTGPDNSGSKEIESLFVLPEDNKLVTDLPGIATVNLDAAATKYFCYTFGPIEEEKLAVGIKDWFNSRRAKTEIHFTDESGKQLYWIYLAPQESGDDALELISDLKKKGIDDYRLISTGNLQNTISLGLYSGREAMNDRIGKLKEQGYKPIVVPYNDGKRLYWVDVRLGMDPAALADIFKGYPSRYNYVPVDCNKIARLATGP